MQTDGLVPLMFLVAAFALVAAITLYPHSDLHQDTSQQLQLAQSRANGR